MKTISKKSPSKSTHKESVKSNPNPTKELKTDSPLSEKDEVKKAESRLQNNSK